ncbi:MAG TPA: DUF1345 domain-containing protein [Candidatus Saccharimonadia bacterium]|nr:DUF1345 domain-containing protein [Candidatus Saccharimonadia bacterium]
MSGRLWHARYPQGIPARVRVVAAFVSGAVAGFIALGLVGWKFVPLAAWDVAALVYMTWTWREIWPMTATATARHANREDPSRVGADVLLIVASLASLIAVAMVLVGAGSASGWGRLLPVALGVVSVVLSWGLVHTVFALRYAKIYYQKPEGGIDFNGAEPPAYSDFAYLAVTIGMTFQVSDTAFRAATLRRVALRHALLAYLFGTVIVATTINLVAGLSK